MIVTLLLLAAAVSGSLTMLWLVRHFISDEVLADASTVSGLVTGILGGLTGVIMAFLISTVWSDYQVAGQLVEHEAITTLTLYRLAASLPPDHAKVLRADIEHYVESVVQDEWPAMMRGDEGAATREILSVMWQHVLAFEPATPREQTLFNGVVEELKEVRETRRARLFRSRGVLPGLLWWFVGSASAATMLTTHFVAVRNVRLHAFETALMAAIFALALITLHDLKRPFSGHIRIEPTVFQETLQVMKSGTTP